MATITTINGSDVISTSDTTINTNFTNLNTDKIETSYLDTDTALTANSDVKIATQKATKAYVDASVNPTGRSWNEYAADAGSTDAYAITLTGISAYATGQTFKFKANTANTGACTLNVSALGAKTIKKDVTTDLATGDILANQDVVVIYDGTNMQLVSGLSGTVTTQNITSNLPPPFFQQRLPTGLTTQGTSEYAFGSKSDGSAFYVYESNAIMKRYAKDTNTGMYYITHIINPTVNISSEEGCFVQIGLYIYMVSSDGANVQITRFLEADLTSETTCTVPTVTCNQSVTAWTDGTDMYLVSNSSDTTSRKWTLSGTTFSASSTATCPANLVTSNGATCSVFDGTNVYIVQLYRLLSGSATSSYIYKLSDIMATAVTSKEIITPAGWLSNSVNLVIAINIDTNRMYIGGYERVYNQTAQYTLHMNFYPVSKT